MEQPIVLSGDIGFPLIEVYGEPKTFGLERHLSGKRGTKRLKKRSEGFITPLMGHQFLKTVFETIHKKWLLDQLSEKQGGASVGRVDVVAGVNSIGKNIPILYKTTVAVIEKPPPFALPFLPATHVISGPIKIAGIDFKDLIVHKIVQIKI